MLSAKSLLSLCLYIVLVVKTSCLEPSLLRTTERGLNADVMKSRIIGGNPAPENRYPFMVFYITVQGFICGGSLVSPSVVLTAAHCLENSDVPQVIKIGCENRITNEGCEFRDFDGAVIFPGYNPITTSGDVAIFFLSTPSSKPVLQLVGPRPDFVIPTGTDLTTIGFGVNDTETELTSDVLLQAEISTFDQEECALRYEPVQNAEIDDSMICTLESGRDACQGDSGGPLLLRCDTRDFYAQVGIVSFGLDCADPFFPGVFSDVSNEAISSFIADQINQREDKEVEFFTDFSDFSCPNGNFDAAYTNSAVLALYMLLLECIINFLEVKY